MPLTNIKIKNAKPREKAFRLYEEPRPREGVSERAVRSLLLKGQTPFFNYRLPPALPALVLLVQPGLQRREVIHHR